MKYIILVLAIFIQSCGLNTNDTTHENGPSLQIKEATLKYQPQTYYIKKSLELKVTRPFQIQFEPLIIENAHENSRRSPYPMMTGELDGTFVVFNNGTNLVNLKENLLTCGSYCIFSSQHSKIKIVKGQASAIGDFDFLHHSLDFLAQRNVFLIQVKLPGSSTTITFSGQIDVSGIQEQTVKLTPLDLTNIESQNLANLVTASRNILDSDLPLVGPQEYFDNLKAEHNPSLANVSKYELCARNSAFFKCMKNSDPYFKIQNISMIYGKKGQKVKTILDRQTPLRINIVDMRETRQDHMTVKNARMDEVSVFAETKVVGEAGLNAVGNGVTWQNSLGLRGEYKWFNVTQDSDITSRRTRASNELSLESVVDRVKLDIDTQTYKCVFLEMKNEKKNYYYCYEPTDTKLSESYYYIYPRILNYNQVNLFDASKSNLNLRKTLFGENNFKKLREILDNNLVGFVDQKNIDFSLQNIITTDQPQRQLPLVVVDEKP